MQQQSESPSESSVRSQLDRILASELFVRWASEIPDIWKKPADGGPATRITYHSGFEPKESPNGRFLYYVDRDTPPALVRPTGAARLMRVPSGGGSETKILDGFTPFWWSMTGDAILFLSRELDADAIDRYDLHSGAVTRVGRLASSAGIFGGQFCVSPDGHWALVTQQQGQAELMLLDNVR